LAKEPAGWCVIPSKEAVISANMFLGLDGSSKLPRFNGASLVYLPGPIDDAPKCMYSLNVYPGKKVRDDEHRIALELVQKAHAEGKRLALPSYLRSTMAYYAVDYRDWPVLLFHKLTEAQRNQLTELLAEQVRAIVAGTIK
jgi:hypothetical protein